MCVCKGNDREGVWNVHRYIHINILRYASYFYAAGLAGLLISEL